MGGSLKYFLYFIYALTALAISISALSRLFMKADLPFEYGTTGHESLIENNSGSFNKGDSITNVDGIDVKSAFEIEVIIDSRLPGDEIPVTTKDITSLKKELTVTLVRYYENYNFIVITAAAGFAFWLLGLFVIISKPDDKAAVCLFLTLVTFSVAILSSSGHFGRDNDLIGYTVRISHTLSYIFGSTFFLMFIINFPYENKKVQKVTLSTLAVLIPLITMIVSYFEYMTFKELTPYRIETYQIIRTVSEAILLVNLIFGILLLIKKYKSTKDITGRTKIEWIFWGMGIGAGPFILFWLIPNIFKFDYLISEEVIILFLIFIPVSLTIAVVKYQVLDIEILIKRSIVYFILIGVLLFLYSELIFLFSNYFTELLGNDSKYIYVFSAIFIALLLNPLRKWIKSFVDKMFYRERYVFDKAIKRISLLTKECHTYEDLGKMLIREITSLIPVKSIAIAARTASGDRIRILAQNNFDNLNNNIGALRLKKLKLKFNLPFSLKQKAEPDLQYSSKLETVLKRWHIAFVVPIALNQTEAAGAIILGDKLSGIKYSVSDYELLNTIASTAALAVKRLELQETLILEELELEKTKEISELKSYFVASVSHDLKTPLSAIKIFTELLQNDKISKDKSKEYLDIINGETDRLKRMIENVLDYSKIEKGLKQYSFKKININESAEEVLSRMNYELNMKKFKVDKCLESHPLYISADPDAVNSVLENLISNSIKYSEKNRQLSITTKQNNGDAEIIIEDSGKGISPDNLSHIFEAFYREASAESSNVKGAGLGLSIVKNIVNAHHGKIELNSKEGKGTTFKIKFPIYQNGNDNTFN